MKTWPRYCVPLMIVVLLLPKPLAVLAQEAAVSAEGQYDVEVVLKKLDTQKEDFEASVAGKLISQRNDIREKMQKTVLELDEKLIAARQNSGDPKARAEYEEASSRAVTQSMSFLKNYVELESGTLNSVGSLMTAVQEARDASAGSKTKLQSDIQARKAQMTQIESKLRSIAVKNTDAITANQPLPESVALDVRLLSIDLSVAQQSADAASLAAEQFDATTAELDLQIAELRSLKDTLTVSFRKAKGQSLVLAQVAGIKANGLIASRMRERMQGLSKIVPKITADLDQVDSVFARLLKRDSTVKPSPGSVVAVSTAESRPELDILKPYLSNQVTQNEDEKEKGETP